MVSSVAGHWAKELEERAAEYAAWRAELEAEWVRAGQSLGVFTQLETEGRLGEVEAWLAWPFPPQRVEESTRPSWWL